jgi:hypothetical protein
LHADDKEIISAMQQKLLLTHLFADPDNLCVWLTGRRGFARTGTKRGGLPWIAGRERD